MMSSVSITDLIPFHRNFLLIFTTRRGLRESFLTVVFLYISLIIALMYARITISTIYNNLIFASMQKNPARNNQKCRHTKDTLPSRGVTDRQTDKRMMTIDCSAGSVFL